MNNFDAAFQAKNKAASDFRARLNAGGARVVGDGPRSRLPPVGIFNADGSPHPMNDLRARAAQIAPPVIEPVAGPAAVSQPGAYGAQPGATLGSRVAMPPPPPPQPVAPTRIPVTGAGGVASGSGKTYWPGTGATPSAPPAPTTAAVEAKPNLLSRAASTIERGIQPPDWKALGSKAAGAAKGLAGGVLGNLNTISNAVAAGDDLGAIWAAPNADMVEKVGASAEALGNTAAGFIGDQLLKNAGVVIPGLAGAANIGLANSRPISALARWVSPNGKSSIDNIRDANGFGEAKSPVRTLGELAMPAKAAEQAAPIQAPEPTKPDSVAGTLADKAAVLSPYDRRDTLEGEFARQQGNGRLIEVTDRAFQDARQKFKSGNAAFQDDATRKLFNDRNALEGTGIRAIAKSNGTTEFTNMTGDTPNPGKVYRAADGSLTTDWSKTKEYADAIQRNTQDQNRLAEMTRGAAMSGDKEAVARLTAGDGRLQAIAEKAATERDLRQAVKDGSAKAAQVLATMENTGADNAFKAQELDLRRAAMVGAQEDRDLDRALRRDALAEKVATANRTAMKDAREVKKDEMATLDKQLEQYATVDGKLDGQRLSRLRGLAANLKPGEGQSPEEFNKDVTTLVSLASKLDDGQAWYDKLISQAGLGGTDLRSWKVNPNRWRGGFVTDQGDHISTSQYNKLTDDEKAFFKSKFLQGGK